MKSILALVFSILFFAPTLAGGEPFGIDQIASSDWRRLEDVLHTLPDSLRSSFTLVYSSRSSQGASFEFPRVIVFGWDAHTILAFNGSDTERGYERLETITFDETLGFQFRELTFSSDGKSAAKASEINPGRCLACHGNPPRPIWSSYSIWPGVYGSQEDSLSASDQEAFGVWRKSRSHHPRYRELLIADEEKNAAAPYYSERGWRKLSFMPNLRLSKLLARLDSRAMVERLRQSGHFEEMAELILFRHLGCDLALPEKEREGALARVDRRIAVCARDSELANSAAGRTFRTLLGLSGGEKSVIPNGLSGTGYYEGGTTKGEIAAALLVENLKRKNPNGILATALEGLVGSMDGYYSQVAKAYSSPDFVRLLDKLGKTLPTQNLYYADAAKRSRLATACRELGHE